MAFVSVTRLRPRSVSCLPGVLLHTRRSKKQVQRARGVLGGYLATGPAFALWTVTVWDDERRCERIAMRPATRKRCRR